MWYFSWWLGSFRLFDNFLIVQAGSPVSTAIILAILVCIIVLRSARKRIWSPTRSDYAALVFSATQIVSTYFGIYHENSIVYGARVTTAANIYFIMRVAGGVNSRLFRILTIGACFMGLCLAIVNIPEMILRLAEWKQLGLNNIIAFRAYFPLVGGVAKIDSLNVVLALLPLSLIVLICEHNRLLRALAIISAIGSCAVILMGMSKGVYLGYLFLCISTLGVASAYKMTLNNEARLFLRISVVSVLLTACGYVITSEHWGGEIRGTTSLEDSSISSRLRIWNNTISGMKGYEISGVGGENGALFALGHIASSAYQPFSDETFNWMLEILLQNGVLGLASFCAFMAFTIISTCRVIGSVDRSPQQRQTVILVQGAIIAILVSDLTYTSVVLHPPVMCILFALAGAVNERTVANSTTRRINTLASVTSHGTVSMVILIGLYFSYLGIRRRYSESEYSRASIAMQKGDYKTARGYIILAEKYSKCDALYASMEGLVLVRSVDSSEEFSNLWQRGFVLSDKDRRQIGDALRAYQRASSCAPTDAEIHNNLAWLYVMLGDEKHAREQIDEAILIEPYTALYHISSGLFYEKNGRLDAAYGEYSLAIAYSPTILNSEFYLQMSKRHADASSKIIEGSKSILSRLQNSPQRMSTLAALLYVVNNNNSVQPMLNDVLSKLPDLSYPWYYLGEIAMSEGDGREAILDYRRALFINPMNRVILARLANIDNAMGEDYEGLWAAQMALMIEPPSEHAMRSERMYSMNPLSPDDVVPTGFLDYTLPQIDVNNLCNVIYQISSRHGLGVPSDVSNRIKALGGAC